MISAASCIFLAAALYASSFAFIESLVSQPASSSIEQLSALHTRRASPSVISVVPRSQLPTIFVLNQ